MKTRILKIIDPERDVDAVRTAGRLIREGRLVAFPTETVYGLGADALSAEAVARIFVAKGRPQDNPLIVHIYDPRQLEELCAEVPERAWRLADRFWPGPLTMVLKKKDLIPDITTAGLDSVAVRCPSHPVARAIIEAAGTPVAAPSANTSGKPSTTSFAHVKADMYGRVDAIVDGGECSIGLESTVVDLTGERPRLLRPGGVTPEQLMEVLGELDIDRAVLEEPDPNAPARSPGMKYRHYAPGAPVIIVSGDSLSAARYIRAQSEGRRAAVLCFDEEKALFKGMKALAYGPGQDLPALARNLFATLRRLDEWHPEVIYARCPEGGGLAVAVRNRLKKAAAFQVVEVP